MVAMLIIIIIIIKRIVDCGTSLTYEKMKTYLGIFLQD